VEQTFLTVSQQGDWEIKQINERKLDGTPIFAEGMH